VRNHFPFQREFGLGEKRTRGDKAVTRERTKAGVERLARKQFSVVDRARKFRTLDGEGFLPALT